MNRQVKKICPTSDRHGDLRAGHLSRLPPMRQRIVMKALGFLSKDYFYSRVSLVDSPPPPIYSRISSGYLERPRQPTRSFATNILTSSVCTAIFGLSLSLASLGCGDNLFKNVDKKDAATDATIALENSNPDKAISILLAELGTAYTTIYDSTTASTDLIQAQADFTTELQTLIDEGSLSNVPNLVSILASARAQKHGIDPFEIALKFADLATSSSTDAQSSSTDTTSTPTSSASAAGNSVTILFPVLPEASDENLEGLDVAMTILRSLGTNKTTSDEYKEALFLTASIALITKTLDTDGDGKISALESVTLSDAAAKALLNQITAAITAAGATGDLTADSETAKSTEQIQILQSKIDEQEGDTQEEKLRNFIAKNDTALP